MQGEERRHAVARDADEDDGLEALPGAGRGDGGDDHHDADHGLRGVVERHRGGGPRPVERERRPDRADEHEQDHAEVERQGSALGRGRGARGDPVDEAHRRPVDAGRVDPGRHARLQREDPVAQAEHGEAHDERARGDEERGLDPVPERQVVRVVELARGARAHGRQCVGVAGDPPVDGRGEEAEHEAGRGQHGRRHEEVEVLVHGLDLVHPALGGERAPHEARAVRDREAGADRDADERDPAEPAAELRVGEERREHRLLGDEAEEGREPGHRRERQGRDDREHRGLPAEPADLAQVARAGAVVHDADHEEEGRLEQRVREQQRDARERRVPRAVPDHDGEEAELADRAVREDELEVHLLEGAPAADEHRRDAERDEKHAPTGHVGVAGREAGDEVDAGLHHGGGMQVRAHRGRRGHRGGQPEVEGHEGRLGERAEEDQHDGDGDELAPGGIRHERGEARGAAGDRQDHEADEHGEPARRGDEERLQRGAAARLLARVVPDEEVGEDARGLPEGEEDEHVVGEDEAEHDARERDEQPGEPAEPLLAGAEVAGAVEEHEGADARDDERQEPRQRVHPHVERDAERRDPLHALDDLVVGEDRGGLRDRVDEGGGRHEGGDDEGAHPHDAGEERDGDGGDQEHREEDDHVRSPLTSRLFPQST